MKGLTVPARIRVGGGIVSVAAIALLAAPSLAQDTTAMRTSAADGTPDAAGFRTHTVRAGETLWDIAHTYLGDGDLWPEIIRANKRLVKDPHWIFPNEVLRVPPRPAGVAADTAGALAAVTPAPQPAAPAVAQAEPAPPATPAPTPEPSTDATPSTPADNAGDAAAGTLFNHPPQQNGLFVTGRGGSAGFHRREGVDAGAHNSAPYLDRDGGPRHAGAIVGVVDESNVIDAARVAHYALDEEVYITMPLGSRPEVGTRFYTYALGQSFGDQGQVVEPTGIVTVTQAGGGKVATTARITQLFGFVELGQGVLPLDQAILPNGAASPTPAGPRSRVVWVEHDQVLPTVGFFVLLDASAKSGVRLGDLFTLYRPSGPTPDGSVTLPESDIAVGQVVRVTPYGSTAIIVSQLQPAVTPGTDARVTARITAGGQ